MSVGAVASAQDYTSGAAEFVVTDSSGNPVSGATVTVTSNDRGSSRTVTTNSNGEAFFGRLQIGSYTARVDGAGYQSVADDAISISIGNTGSYAISLSAASGSTEVITVTGSAANLSTFGVAETGLVIDVDDTFKDIPIGRSLTSLALLAPGSTAADSAFGGASISGSSAGENVFYVNGMNITDFRNFLGSSTVPFEFYDQVEIKTGGYGAEFGRNTGGVLNAVTKSGSNEFHGGISHYYTPDSLRSDSPDTFAAANRFDERHNQETNVWASGPIIKDRLFFYGLYQMNDFTARNISGISGRESYEVTDDPFYALKFDATLFDGHTLEYTFFHDADETVITSTDYTFDDAGNLASSSEVGDTNISSGGQVEIAKYTGAFTDWFTMSVLKGEQTFDQTTNGALDGNPAIYDNTDGQNFIPIGNFTNFIVDVGNDKRELFRVDADFRFDLFGGHNLRVGFDEEILSAQQSAVNSGGVYYLYRAADTCEQFGGVAGEECVRVRTYESGGQFETVQSAWYIQDSWEVTDKLTLELGLRNETFDNKNANGETFVKIEDQIAPRFAASYDVKGDGSLELYGAYGRYFLPVASNTNIRLAGAETYIQEYYQIQGGTFESGSNADETPIITSGVFATQLFSDGSVPDTRSLINPDLDPMYVDEVLLGVAKRWDNFELEASYTWRDLASTLEDIAIDAAVLDYCDANGITGCDAIWTGFHSYVLTNPGVGFTFQTDELPGTTGFTDVPLTAEQLGYPEAERTYEALEFRGRYDADRWFLQGSWTMSSSEGNYEGPVKSDNGQDDAGITQDFDQPGLVDGSDGLLPNHRAHKIKLWGNYEVTDALSVGGNLNVTSPRKFGCIGVHPTDEFAQAYGTSSWYCGGELTPRGESLESDWVSDLDLSAQYAFQDLDVGSLVLRVDVFNVFNQSNVTDLNEYGDASGNGLGTDFTFTADEDYGKPLGYQAPRSVRIGIDYRF